MSRPNTVKIMDFVAAVPSILMDTDQDRRRLYGKAGAHRPKMVINDDPYDGVEYRTLSNFWLASSYTIAWAYRACKRAVEEYDTLLPVVEEYGQTIVNTINKADRATAEKLVEKFDLEVVNA